MLALDISNVKRLASKRFLPEHAKHLLNELQKQYDILARSQPYSATPTPSMNYDPALLQYQNYAQQAAYSQPSFQIPHQSAQPQIPQISLPPHSHPFPSPQHSIPHPISHSQHPSQQNQQNMSTDDYVYLDQHYSRENNF